MGEHYVPQYYLKGFSNAENKQIWVYDKADSKVFSTYVKRIANENNFYDPKTEQYLANTIEGPANAVLKKLRKKIKFSESDKRILTNYIVVMMKRVPHGRMRINNLVPSVAEELAQKIDAELNTVASDQPDKTPFIQKTRSQINKIIDKYSSEPPKDMWLENIPPEKTPKTIEAIATMTWQILICDQRLSFLTSDNPVFYFTEIGVGKPESEVTLPISSHLALWASYRSNLTEGYIQTTSQVVKEVNRRTASILTRYAFHQLKEKWILPFIQKGKWQLHPLL